MEAKSRAVVLFSGGLDSTTILYQALDQNYQVHALSFSYEQRHSIELQVAQNHCKKLGIQHNIIDIPVSVFQGSALTGDIEVPKDRQNFDTHNDIPVTYVPVRNLILLSLAAAYAESHEIGNIFIGVNAVDYSGYPDCRPEFIESFESTLNLASKAGQTGKKFKIHTPLIRLTKQEIIETGLKLNVPYENTWSCYDPQVDKEKKEITPCKKCDSCVLRQKGFEQAGKTDPLVRIIM